jgi:hypothetical protein
MDGILIFVLARRRQIETGSETTRKWNAAVTFFNKVVAKNKKLL